MPGSSARERAAQSDGCWTLETLKAYIESMFEAQERLNQQRFEALRDTSAAAMLAATTAVTKAEAATEKRLENVNEFRNTLSDQQRNLMPRSEFEALEKALTFRLDALDRQLEAHRAERNGMRGGWAMAIGAVGFVLTVLTIIALVTAYFK